MNKFIAKAKQFAKDHAVELGTVAVTMGVGLLITSSYYSGVKHQRKVIEDVFQFPEAISKQIQEGLALTYFVEGGQEYYLMFPQDELMAKMSM